MSVPLTFSTEPVGSVENVSGTLMLAENDKVLDILLGGAAE